MKIFNVLLILIVFLLTSCQSVKDGLSGKKRNNSDEFLVQKKKPLVTPPDFLELPEPESQSNKKENKNLDDNTDIQKLLKISGNKKKRSNSSSGTAEDFVLNQIKNK